MFAEDIIKLYEDKDQEDGPDDELSRSNANEQTLFPEKDVMLELVESSTKETVEEVNSDEELESSDTHDQIKPELKHLKSVMEGKDKLIVEKDDILMDKDIEITTMKDEVESLEKENRKKSVEMEILIASNNSLDEEKTCLY